MALFDVLKKEKKKTEKPEKKKEETKTEALSKAIPFVMEPHISEKSTLLNEKGVYIFEIGRKINNIMVRRTVKEKYGVLPQKINIVNIPPKKISFRGKKGTKKGFKKAIVYLKKGDKIELG